MWHLLPLVLESDCTELICNFKASSMSIVWLLSSTLYVLNMDMKASIFTCSHCAGICI